MSTPTNITSEQLIKAACLGYATHALTSGVPEAKVKVATEKFKQIKLAKLERTRGICKALLGGVDSKIFAEQAAA